jgi:hypothetical protein
MSEMYILVLAGDRVVSRNSSRVNGSACQEFALGSCEFLIGQHALGVQVGKLLELSRQVILSRCLWSRGWGRILRRGRRHLLLLCLGIGCSLLVGLIILLLGCGILLGVLLLLVVLYRTGGTGHDCRADSHTRHTSSYCSSSHHVDLFSFMQPLPA